VKREDEGEKEGFLIVPAFRGKRAAVRTGGKTKKKVSLLTSSRKKKEKKKHISNAFRDAGPNGPACK